MAGVWGLCFVHPWPVGDRESTGRNSCRHRQGRSEVGRAGDDGAHETPALPVRAAKLPPQNFPPPPCSLAREDGADFGFFGERLVNPC